jgi:ABC-type branched-subunit amino acid transport system substrate-binding protein
VSALENMRAAGVHVIVLALFFDEFAQFMRAASDMRMIGPSYT